MRVLRRRLAAEGLSSNEAETLGWQLVRLFVHWRCLVDTRRRRLAAAVEDPSFIPPETIGWRLARLFFSWRLFVDMCQVRRAAVARVVLQRRLDAATINHVLSYLHPLDL